MAKDVRKPEFWNKFLQRPEVATAMKKKIKYESFAEQAKKSKVDKLERKQQRYDIMHELMQCATNVKHLVSPMFRYKITQRFLWKALCEARKEGLLFCDKLRQPQVYHRLMAIKAEITAGPYGVAGWQAEEEVEEDLMDKMVVEADCIPGGVDGEAADRKQVLDKREIQGVLDFGQQIKSEGNEAFQNENWEGALTRYCQGDEMLKNFRAEPHLERENKELKTMHRACLNNKANAALKMDQWQNALRASESALRLKCDDEKALFRKAQALKDLGRTDEALETLKEVEQIAEDFDEEIREAILDDVREQRAEIKDIDRKAAKEFRKMFKAMGDKKVFGEGRFLPDGTSPPPALTGEQERKLKRMKDKQEYDDAKAKHDMLERKKEGKKLIEPPKEPDMPTPNKPAILSYGGYKALARTKTITKTQAEELLQELMTAYSPADFQKKVHNDAKAVLYEYQPFVRRLRKTAFAVQEPVLNKWGFDPSEEGLHEMMICLSEHTLKDDKLRKLADEVTRMLMGGEDGMYGMDED
jgi:tetratricopeptide (TPR) repeat protein